MMSKDPTSEVECQQHPGQTCISYCLDCDCVVCLPCILSPECHQGHKCTSLNEVTSERKSQAISHLDQLKDQSVVFTQTITELRQNKEDLESDCKIVLKQIQTRTENLHLELDQIKEDSKIKLKEFLDRENTMLKANIEMLETESCKLQSLLSFIDERQKDETSQKVSDMSSIIYYSAFLKPLRSSYLLRRPYFDTEAHDSLNGMFGRLQLKDEHVDDPELGSTDKDKEPVADEKEDGSTCTMTCADDSEELLENQCTAEILRRSYKTSSHQEICASLEDEMMTMDPKQIFLRTRRTNKRPSSIHNRSIIDMNVRLRAGYDHTMWLTGYGSRDITQIRMDGTQVKRLQTSFDIDDFALNSKQELFVTEKQGKIVRKYNDSIFSFRWSRFAGFQDIYTTTGICCTRHDNLLVCLQRKLPAGKIVKLSETGTHLLDIEFGTDGSPLFKWPRQVIHNPLNGNICVIDEKNVVVIKENSKTHFTVNGETFQDFPESHKSAYSTRLLPEGMDVDQRGHLYISDFGNGRVCEYNTEGQFVKVMKDTVYQVTGLAVDTSGYLWIGGAGGNLFVTDTKT